MDPLVDVGYVPDGERDDSPPLCSIWDLGDKNRPVVVLGRDEAADEVSVVVPVIFRVLGAVGEPIRPTLIVLHGRDEDAGNLIYVFGLGVPYLNLGHGGGSGRSRDGGSSAAGEMREKRSAQRKETFHAPREWCEGDGKSE